MWGKGCKKPWVTSKETKAPKELFLPRCTKTMSGKRALPSSPIFLWSYQAKRTHGNRCHLNSFDDHSVAAGAHSTVTNSSFDRCDWLTLSLSHEHLWCNRMLCGWTELQWSKFNYCESIHMYKSYRKHFKWGLLVHLLLLSWSQLHLVLSIASSFQNSNQLLRDLL